MLIAHGRWLLLPRGAGIFLGKDTMKAFAIGLALSLTFISLAQAGNNLPEIEVVSSENQRWYFRQVTVNHSGDGLNISGRMNATQRFGLPNGHVDIAAWAADNKQLIAETTASYSPRILTWRALRKGGVRFTAKLPILPPGARIKVAFHRDEPQKPSNPVHDQTVAF